MLGCVCVWVRGTDVFAFMKCCRGEVLYRMLCWWWVGRPVTLVGCNFMFGFAWLPVCCYLLGVV